MHSPPWWVVVLVWLCHRLTTTIPSFPPRLEYVRKQQRVGLLQSCITNVVLVLNSTLAPRMESRFTASHPETRRLYAVSSDGWIIHPLAHRTCSMSRLG